MSVLADGCFDPLHVGHIRYLEAAAEYGLLVVRVAPDTDIEAKGRRPFQTREERMEMVRALECVFHVVDHDTLVASLRLLKPSALIKSAKWAGRLPGEVVAACHDLAIDIIYTHTDGKSSTERLA